MGVENYNSSPSSNTTLASTSLAEGQTRQRDLNDQIRQILADVKRGVPMRFDDVAAVQAVDNSASSGTISATILVDGVGSFYYDSADSSTAHDGTEVLVTASGERYKIFGDPEDYQPNVKASSELTVASGAITLSRYSHTVDTESDASADTLTDITWWSGVKAGDTAEIRAENIARVVTIESNTGAGKIKTPDDRDIVLDETTKVFRLLWDGTQTQVISGVSTGGEGDYVTFLGNAEDTASASNWTLLKTMIADSANAGKIIYFPDTGSATYSLDIGDEAAVDIGGAGRAVGLKTAPGAEIKLVVPTQSSTRRIFNTTGDCWFPAKITVDTMAAGAAIYLIGWESGSPNLDYLEFDGNMTYNGLTGYVGGNLDAKPSVIILQNGIVGDVADLSMRHAKISNYWRWMLKATQDTGTLRCTVEHCVLSNSQSYLGFNSPEGESAGHLYNNNHFFGWADGTITTSGSGENWGYGISGTRMHNTTISNNVFHGNFKEAIHIEEAGENTIICNNKSGNNFRGSGIALIENVVGGTDEDHGTEHWFKRMQIYGNVFVSTAKTELVVGDNVRGFTFLGLTSGQSWLGVFGQGLGGLECKVHDNHFENFYYGIQDRFYDYAQEWYFANEVYNNTIKDCTIALRPFKATIAWRENTLIDNTNNCCAVDGGTFGPQRFIFSTWSSGGHELVGNDPDTVTEDITVSLHGFELMTYLKLPNVANNSTADIDLINADEIVLWDAPLVSWDFMDIPSTSGTLHTKTGCWNNLVFNNTTLNGGLPIRHWGALDTAVIVPELEYASGTPNTIRLTFDTTSIGEATTFAMSMNARNSFMVARILS